MALPPRRFIPARAGNSRDKPRQMRVKSVHPRACGEQTRQTVCSGVFCGSSPRVRGTEQTRPALPGCLRFIPARAGNRARFKAVRPQDAVHPRACGEQMLLAMQTKLQGGSSPRVRGTDTIVSAICVPRRFIPARAGNSCHKRDQCSALAVHPRACGEQIGGVLGTIGSSGSSPRVRGTVAVAVSRVQSQRFIPARAGNRRLASARRCLTAVHPRACGEQFCCVASPSAFSGSSPRVRGTDHGQEPDQVGRRFIPARAGNRHSPQRQS